MVPSLSSAALLLSGSLELSLLVKATLLLAVGLVAARFAHRARASVRHLVISTTFIALAALPVLMISVPALTIDVPVASTTLQPVNSIAFAPASIEGAPMAPNVVERSLPALSVWQWLRLVWLAGVLAFLFPVASALWRLSMIRRTGLPVAWRRATLAGVADARGVSLPVELLEHEGVPGPMTFGIGRPVIVLPLDAREWPEAELRCALMHEIEHIQRGDWLMQIIARTVAAFYWFHPMVWSAWRRLCLEAERSCDDAVVASEERTAYAEQLVMLAQRMSATPVQPILGMANRSDLSTRVAAVLDDRLHRGRAGFALAAGTVVALALVVGSVAPVRAVAKAEPAAVTANDHSSARALVEAPARAVDRGLHNAANAVNSAVVKELHETDVQQSKNVEGLGGPQAPVQIAKEQTRSIFVLGEVRTPGKYLIAGDVTLLEVIAKAGSLTASAGPVVIVQRHKDPAVTGAGTPAISGDKGTAEVVRVALDDLKQGRIVPGLALRDGDTVFVPAADRSYGGPQAPVQIAKDLTRSIFVIGEVRVPGRYLIAGDVTLLEVIAKAGWLTASAGSVVIVQRRKDAAVSGAGALAVPGENAIELVRVALDDLKQGRIVPGLALRDGDTVYVPAADRYYVTGFVRSPGSYLLAPKMTVLQAIAIAGGVSETGSIQGIKIIRRVDDKSVEIDVADDDLIEPNDTIRVRQRLQ